MNLHFLKDSLVIGSAIIVILIFLIDLFVFKGLSVLLKKYVREKVKRIISFCYWTLTGATIILLIIGFTAINSSIIAQLYRYYFLFGAFFISIYLPKLIFALFVLLDRITSIVIRVASRHKVKFFFFSKAGFIIATLISLYFIYGSLFTKYDFVVRKETLSFKYLPASFDKCKIVHISDLHLACFSGNEKKLEEAVDMINAENPDLIMFTGDLTNTFAEEAQGFESILNKLRAKYGKFSVLGNHDYGFYFKWKSDEARLENLTKLKEFQKKIGFRLLCNEFDSIVLNHDKIIIIGVENWDKKQKFNFSNLDKAVKGIDTGLFKILLSHNPGQWKAEVAGKTNIDLTLSGHTHGMQIGVDIAGFRWSPAKYIFHEWGGLYTGGHQFLNVNTGLGFVGFAMRAGIPPEITVIELKRE